MKYIRETPGLPVSYMKFIKLKLMKCDIQVRKYNFIVIEGNE